MKRIARVVLPVMAAAMYAGCPVPELEREPSYQFQIGPDRFAQQLGGPVNYSPKDCDNDGTIDMILALDEQGDVQAAYFADLDTDPTFCDYSAEPRFQMSAQTAQYASQVNPLMLGLANSLAVDNLYNEQDFADSLERKVE